MKGAAIKILMVIGWTAVLPLVGYSLIAMLTVVPLLGLFLGPWLLIFIYGAGGVPAFVTAAGFECLFHRWGFRRSLIATVTLGMVSTLVWAIGTGYLPPQTRPWAAYVTFSLLLSAAFAAALMPLTRFAQDRRCAG
ncbi:hypothetical protein [Erythrobacter sp. R86502]|uniref:hypothetical protein n=1 Tax=Erythrobacter sp. R86502 TaxID=3093846 RepID=UPI0036D23BEE